MVQNGLQICWSCGFGCYLSPIALF
uniref:Uncharacterized protein n=1 Tax=Rhizophora mucronata TaxID=61149 RepID=A0A2P2P617_RHIMU